MKRYSIAAAIIRSEGHIVMVRQTAPEIIDGSFWSLPGGKLEAGESFIEAAIREVKEETGLDVQGIPEFIYTCEYKNEKEGYSCWVEMYEFTAFNGMMRLNDPDQSIEEVMLFTTGEAIKKLEGLQWPMVKDPSIAYLKDNTQRALHWRYEADDNGVYHLMEIKGL